MALATVILCAAPAFAADAAASMEGAPGMVKVLLYSYAPWIAGFILDIAIAKMSVKLLKCAMTATLSMVLGYPSVLFSFSSFVAPGGPDSAAAWAMASAFLTFGLFFVKIVSYWVVNESFPSKKAAALFLVDSMVMVGVSFAMLKFAQK